LGGPPSDAWMLVSPPYRPLYLAFGLVVIGLFGFWVLPTLKQYQTSRFWALGAALASLPAAATLPNDRLLYLVSLGGLAVVAQAMHDSFRRVLRVAPGRGEAAGAEPGVNGEPALAVAGSGSSPSRLRTALAGVAVIGHVCVSVLALPIRSLEIEIPATFVEQADATIPKTPAVTEKTAIIAHVPASLVTASVPLMRVYRNEPRPKRLYWLVATPAKVAIQRTGEATLRVAPALGFMDQELEQHYRGQQDHFKVGDRVELSEMMVEILSLTPDGRPLVCDFRFREPLESSRYLWLTWRPGGFVTFEPPKLGETIESSVEGPDRSR
jgi:hypothetical protein